MNELVDRLAQTEREDCGPLLDEFIRLHQLIRCDADKQAAQAVIDVLQGNI